jgi:acylphosphatase
VEDFLGWQVWVQGRVQGVGYRAFCLREAQALGLAGWVRNEEDGSVKLAISGAEESFHCLLERLRRGPRFAEPRSCTFECVAEEWHGEFRILG